MQKRSKARELALQILYQFDFETYTTESTKYVFSEFEITDPEINEFSKLLISGVIENVDSIDKLIEVTLINWKLSRISLIDKTLLRMGLFEIVKIDGIEKNITISEIIKLTKNYSDAEAYKFINGILDRFDKTGDFKTALRE
ncbi:transcription antitermination factor NusB [Candidatus Dependentiae bacterium]|nr:transcription antitermination factor NusB [Candidatus Dependentiae bacterium]